MSILPQGQANLIDYPIFNAQVPKEGPKAIALVAPFTSSAQSFDVNLLLTQSLQFMSLVQAVFVDNSANAVGVTITVTQIGQQLKVPANSQGYLPLLVTKNSKLTISSTVTTAANVTVIFLNVPVPAAVWAT